MSYEVSKQSCKGSTVYSSPEFALPDTCHTSVEDTRSGLLTILFIFSQYCLLVLALSQGECYTIESNES